MVKLDVVYDGRSIVTLTCHSTSKEQFDVDLAYAHEVIRWFKRSNSGSDWGCEGVGYAVQRDRQDVVIHRSGVGPRKYKAMKAELMGSNHNANLRWMD